MRHSTTTHHPKRQEGFSLVVAMLFLLLISLLSVAAIRGVTMQERMAGNTQDWNLAFQAAEAALRDAETDIRTTGRVLGIEGFTANCGDGLCLPSTDGTSVWKADDSWQGNNSVTYGAMTATTAFPGVNRQPRYKIEALGKVGASSLAISGYGGGSPAHYAYRVTAVGFGNILDSAGNPATKVFTQSVFTN